MPEFSTIIPLAVSTICLFAGFYKKFAGAHERWSGREHTSGRLT